MNIPGPIAKGSLDWEIVDVDYWEQDATLVLNGHRYYFQFSDYKNITLEDALQFLTMELKP